MWYIWVIALVTGAALTNPDLNGIKDNTPVGQYKVKQFTSEDECMNFLLNPDEHFQSSQDQFAILREAIPGLNFKFECHNSPIPGR